MTDLRIAVYTIAKNEAQFARRWGTSVEGADFIVVGDTGSNDGTQGILRQQFLGINVIDIHVVPWRFDDARNAVLHRIPEWVDVCVSLDMDEVLPDNWREVIENAWTKDTHVGWYNFVWSHNESGEPAVSFKQHKIHSRYGWHWKSPVHEDLEWYGEGNPNRIDLDLTIHHWPDSSKSRSSYLPLLKVAVREDPTNWRMSHYYGRELMYHAQYEEAIEELFRCAAGTGWDVEKAVSFIYISDCYLAVDNLEWADIYAEWAVDAKPDLREAWVQRAKVSRIAEDEVKASQYAIKALGCWERYPTYMNNDYAWTQFEKDFFTIELVKSLCE